MEKLVELYDNDGFIEALDRAWHFTEKICDRYSRCIDCPFQYEEDDIDCIGSLLGEAWRRMKNKNL